MSRLGCVSTPNFAGIGDVGLFCSRNVFLKNGPELRCELRIQAEMGLCVQDFERELKILNI